MIGKCKNYEPFKDGYYDAMRTVRNKAQEFIDLECKKYGVPIIESYSDAMDDLIEWLDELLEKENKSMVNQTKADILCEIIDKIKKHQLGLKSDYENHIISEDAYMYRDDECLWIIEMLEGRIDV